MKDFRQANKGKAFEEYIAYSNRAYLNSDVAVITKQYVEMLPIRNHQGAVVSCKVGEKSTVDYLGRFRNIPIAIEAKNTKSGVIRFDAVQDHQARFLKQFTSEGQGIGLVLVSFNLDRFFAIPSVFWLAAREKWEEAKRKSEKKTEKVTISCFGQTWTTPGKASIRPEELLPEWECFPHNTYVLHYLKNAMNYITPVQP